MIISGIIDVDDHMNVMRFIQMRSPAWLRLYAFFAGIATASVALVIGWVLMGADGIHVASRVWLISALVGFGLLVLRMKLALWHFRRHAEIHNLGSSSYRIEGDCIYFSGTTFDCVIPVRSIRDVRENCGTRFLVFGNASGFIIPRKITSGSWEAFKAELLQRMASN